MKRTTLCPCGSGKPQVRCCGENAKTRINLRMIVIWSFIILVGSAITVIAFNRPSSETPTTTVGATPTPYQYDPITNKHWDPVAQHWHDGPAPTGATSNPFQLSAGGDPAATSPLNPTNFNSATSGINLSSGSKVPAPANIINPTPWQYDAATHRHYDPNHAHWHSGRPSTDPDQTVRQPSGTEVSAPPNIFNPLAWQYDTATDRHYDPNHAHWHSGLPPPEN